MSYQPRGGEGFDCNLEEAGCAYPLDRPLEFAFDRWLLPSTATRQSIRVTAVGTDGIVHWQPLYDMVTRTVTYQARGGWDEGFIYDLQFFDPKKPNDDWGFRSYDNQLLERDGLPEHVLFVVGPAAAIPEVVTQHTGCRDALQAFAAAGCSSGHCHRSASNCVGLACSGLPVAGMALDSGPALSATIGRVARATDRGGLSGTAASVAQRFGVNMPLVEAGEPALSLVLVRLLLDRDAYRNADGEFVVQPPSTEELERATTWFGVTGPMPPREVGWPYDASPIDLVTTIQRWIRDGATTDDCE